ncbi:MAG TPA: tRNA epoxyqueuosine(34) reductase QueG [Elusimicrobiota bacterium]|nr:tRNA epoxyqueuosine(34) reductase QueG [Elusimicrobiota bacterium]
MTRRLREEARAQGADAVGFAPAALPPDPGGAQALHDWLAAGMHGEMDYMARKPEDRADVRRWFPAAQSVMICAFSYHDGTPPPAPDGGRGRLARYARAPDYHRELKARLKRILAVYHSATAGGEGKLFVDTNPVLERLYARYAGVGWVGKNAMVVSKDIGSFFILAGLALDRELESDEPAPDHCGSCARCLDACPTDAFPAPRVLDAGRCVAYHTVERKDGPVPGPLRAGHGDWIFGCDVCQDVCPFNRFAVRGSVLRPSLPPTLDLERLAVSSEEAFAARYEGTPLQRTGRRALARNAALAMGNSGERRLVPALRRLAAGADPLLAEQARWSLERLSAERPEPAAARTRATEPARPPRP